MYVRAVCRAGTGQRTTFDRTLDIDMPVNEWPLDREHIDTLRRHCLACLQAEGHDVTAMKFVCVDITPF